jgi:hypothetical protein
VIVEMNEISIISVGVWSHGGTDWRLLYCRKAYGGDLREASLPQLSEPPVLDLLHIKIMQRGFMPVI